ncbi:MAG: hypothetical protein U1F45_08910 [Burkholderiales bacterium]
MPSIQYSDSNENSCFSLVDRDLAVNGVKNDFYPVGAAASYGLLYLLIRILRENEIGSIVEFGSGESRD